MADICVSSHHSSIEELLRDVEFRALAGREGFLIELRLDQYADLGSTTLDQALKVYGPRAVTTYRHPEEGGRNPGATDAERLGFLQRAAEQGSSYIDIEARTPREGFRKGAARLILSFHDFQGVPEAGRLEIRAQSMLNDPDADVVKIACAPETVHDSVPLLKLLAAGSNPPLVVIGMGQAGFWTRIAGPLFGAPFTYARGENAPGTAPGQPTWRELDELYRFRSIRPGWPVYGVMGNPIAHSLSPLMHNTGLRELGLDGVYIPFRVERDPIGFIKAFAPLNIRALSVTIPHKEAVRFHCDEIHGLAESIGAVNTLILRPDGTWWGTNTDAFAAANALEEITGSLYGKNVLVLGAGGAAKAVAFGLKVRGANVFVLNRTIEHAVTLATAVDGEVISQAELKGDARFAAVINTTPLGMHPDIQDSPLEKDQIPEGSIVFDTVYNPLRTKLLQFAAERGCRTLEGVSMFIRQGVQQFELYSSHKAPQEAMEKAVLSELRRRQKV